MTLQEQAYNDYAKGLKYKEIAEKYGVSINTVKSWKQRHGWTRKKGASKAKKGAPFFNQNAIGNRSSPPPKNKRAEKHGLFSQYLPDETNVLIQEIEKTNPIDLLWHAISLKYAAIIRSQKIMFVKDRDDMTKELKRERNSDQSDEQEYEVQFAWDKQASFLIAQGRAMGTLNNMIKQYEELCRQENVDEEHRLRIAKLKAEVDDLQNNASQGDIIFTFERGTNEDEEPQDN